MNPPSVFQLKATCLACNRPKGSVMCDLCGRWEISTDPELVKILNILTAPLRPENQ